MLSRIYGVLLPFFVSFLLAYLLDPLVNFVQNKCRVKFRGSWGNGNERINRLKQAGYDPTQIQQRVNQLL